MPDPTCSKTYDEALINDCLANGTVDPIPTVAGTDLSRVIVDMPDTTGVALFIV